MAGRMKFFATVLGAAAAFGMAASDAQAAATFFELPKLHPMDDHEVAHAAHVIQSKLLSRPAYRRYRELLKN